jgi:hypothetical protein
VKFDKEKLRRLLAFEPLANCRLDRIDEALISRYSEIRSRQASRYGRPVAPASVNRELATIRRLLRRARDLKVTGTLQRSSCSAESGAAISF